MYIDSCIVPTYYYDPHKLAWGLLFSGAHSHWGCSPSTHTPYTNIFKSFFYYIHTYIYVLPISTSMAPLPTTCALYVPD